MCQLCYMIMKKKIAEIQAQMAVQMAEKDAKISLVF